MKRLLALLLAPLLLASTAAGAGTPIHAGWPKIDGMLLINRIDGARPLDARPGYDPFGRADPSYSCDGVHKHGGCHAQMVPCSRASARARRCSLGGRMVAHRRVHNELLGGHGNDTIHAGPTGDVIWGDYKPSGQPTTQVDHLYGGAGKDFIYASHGRNVIHAGGGPDRIHAHFGRGEIFCDSRRAIVYVSHRSRPHYVLVGCAHVSFRSVGHS